MHSIIIPHRDFNRYLGHCLFSIERSAEVCGVHDYEVVVVDQGSRESPLLGHRCIPGVRARLIQQARSQYFNKPRAQNAGIKAARGDVLSFLDADTLVGHRWMENIRASTRLGPRALTKICYRVRYLPEISLRELDSAADPFSPARRYRPGLAGVMEAYCDYCDTLPIAFEGYGEAHTDRTQTEARQPVFGNSQFSIKRTVLGGLRFDEEFQGRGYEDIWMNREIWRHYGDDYRAGIVTDPEHALLHIKNPYPSTPEALELWGPGKQNGANMARYEAG
jgi:glycosyltransferase involved in cell wall biosynthesis